MEHRVLQPLSYPIPAAIPAGAPRIGVLSAPYPLIGESKVRSAAISDDSSAEYSGNSASETFLTNSGSAGCDPAGIADQISKFEGLSIQNGSASRRERDPPNGDEVPAG